MSLWKVLFDFVDKERTRFDNVRHDTHALQFEIEANIHFFVDGVAQAVSTADIINGLETKAFEHAMLSGLHIRQGKLASPTIEGYKEFDKYLGEPSDVLVKNLYLKITLLQKLINAGKFDQDRKLKALFRLLMLVHFHLANKPLPKPKPKPKA
jgi:hypothetical protein